MFGLRVARPLGAEVFVLRPVAFYRVIDLDIFEFTYELVSKRNIASSRRTDGANEASCFPGIVSYI